MYTGLAGFYSRWVHRLIERPFVGMSTPVVMEVGAGHGQHAAFLRSNAERYIEIDIDPALAPPKVRFANAVPVERFTANAEDLSGFADNSVDRLIATCLLAHLNNTDKALSEWRRVVKPGGWITIYIPSEPGMLLRFARKIFMVRKVARYGQDHMATIYKDHRNHYPGMMVAIQEGFAGAVIRQRQYPVHGIGWNFSLFNLTHIQLPQGEVGPQADVLIPTTKD